MNRVSLIAIAVPKNDPCVNIFSVKPGNVEKSFTFGEHWIGCARWGNYEMMGDNHLRTPNEPNGLEVYYYLSRIPEQDQVSFRVTDMNDRVVAEPKAGKEPGLHRYYIRTERLKPGTYKVSLLVGKSRVTKTAVVLESPIWEIK